MERSAIPGSHYGLYEGPHSYCKAPENLLPGSRKTKRVTRLLSRVTHSSFISGSGWIIGPSELTFQASRRRHTNNRSAKVQTVPRQLPIGGSSPRSVRQLSF